VYAQYTSHGVLRQLLQSEVVSGRLQVRCSRNRVRTAAIA
jgi:hypothetical protein